jgi:hypothetical protein
MSFSFWVSFVDGSRNATLDPDVGLGCARLVRDEASRGAQDSDRPRMYPTGSTPSGQDFQPEMSYSESFPALELCEGDTTAAQYV